MNWQLASLALLAAALGAGFAWYERARPDARIVALVATLAAFAALGRIAFAAVPNVKPTTDIVLISGYALGGGPGFAVGALAGLTSNFFFGQGPWTPWQMAGWGATGVLGAGLAWATAPRWRALLGAGTANGPTAARHGQPWIGRWPLAIACCLAGFAFTVMQDVGDWVTYSDHSVGQLRVYVGKGLGFDAIHAAGCLAFALAFGPALTRSIQRFARRLQVRWLPPGTVAPAIAVVAAAGVATALHIPAKAAAAPGVGGSVSYLLGAENRDGGFGAAPGQASNQLYSGWAALGLAATGHSPARLARGSHGLIGYIRATAGSASDVGSLERTILVIRAAGLPARSFGGRDLVAMLERRVRRNGAVSGQVNLTSFAILALRAAGVMPARRTLAWLVGQQNRDGGFGFAAAGSQSDVDDTGAALEALAGQRVTGAATARARAVAYLRHRQDRDGGFGSLPGEASNAQSTAWAIQGLDAVGVNPASLHRHGSVSPLAYLRGLIAPNGSIRYAGGVSQTPVWVTGEALMALEGKPLPLAPVRVPAASPSSAAPLRPWPGPTSAKPAAVSAPPPQRSSHHISNWLLELASGVGFATALMLAPIGLG